MLMNCVSRDCVAKRQFLLNWAWRVVYNNLVCPKWDTSHYLPPRKTFLTIIKFCLKLFWVVVYCWLPIIFPRDAINFSMMPLCGVLMLNFFIGDTWNNWGVEYALVSAGAINCGFGWGSMILFFLKWSLLSMMTAGGEALGSGELEVSNVSPLVMLLLRLDACSFLSSISRFSTSLISFWMRITCKDGKSCAIKKPSVFLGSLSSVSLW